MNRIPRTFLLLIATQLLSGCEFYTDPAYNAAAARIPNTTYPAKAIAGQWFCYLQLNAGGTEKRSYLDINPNGTGTHRIVLTAHNFANGLVEKLPELVVPVEWTYLGHNQWKVIPRPDAFALIMNAPNFGSFAPFILRFAPPRLYDVTNEVTYVPMNNEAMVREKLNEQRAIPRVPFAGHSSPP